MSLLAHEGFDPAFGARPLKRVIQREIGDRAAVLILEGRATEGSTIRVDARPNRHADQLADGPSDAERVGRHLRSTMPVSGPSILQKVRTELTDG